MYDVYVRTAVKYICGELKVAMTYYIYILHW